MRRTLVAAAAVVVAAVIALEVRRRRRRKVGRFIGSLAFTDSQGRIGDYEGQCSRSRHEMKPLRHAAGLWCATAVVCVSTLTASTSASTPTAVPGEIERGMANGKGVWVCRDEGLYQPTYRGDFVDGQMHGQGRCVWVRARERTHDASSPPPKIEPGL